MLSMTSLAEDQAGVVLAWLRPGAAMPPAALRNPQPGGAAAATARPRSAAVGAAGEPQAQMKYPHQTRVITASGGEVGPHSARDPV